MLGRVSIANPILLALVAGFALWAMTALGSGVVLVHREPGRRLLDTLLGFTAGVMLAASYFSLLAPALDLSRGGAVPAWLPPAAGFLVGGLTLWGLDKLLPHLHPGVTDEEPEGPPTGWRRATLLFLAVTLHHVPEGLAVGVAFGAAALGAREATIGTALALAVGLGLQNMPEGVAVAVSMRREGMSPARSFLYGQSTGVVEPLAAALGAAVVVGAQAVLPYALGFAAGAMIFVVIEELVPECQACGNTDIATLGAILGFALMMVLDIALA
jgi:zinc transporter, ZIP family